MTPRTRDLQLNNFEAWAIQAVVREDADSLDPLAGLTLRQKVNGVLLRYAFLASDEKPPDYVVVPVTLAECWVIDHYVPQTLYEGARDLLLRVFAVMRELEFGVPPLRRPEEISSENEARTKEGGEAQATAV